MLRPRTLTFAPTCWNSSVLASTLAKTAGCRCPLVVVNRRTGNQCRMMSSSICGCFWSYKMLTHSWFSSQHSGSNLISPPQLLGVKRIMLHLLPWFLTGWFHCWYCCREVICLRFCCFTMLVTLRRSDFFVCCFTVLLMLQRSDLCDVLVLVILLRSGFPAWPWYVFVLNCEVCSEQCCTIERKCEYWCWYIIIHSFYIALFSALEQTQCAHVACDSEWVTVSLYSAYY